MRLTVSVRNQGAVIANLRRAHGKVLDAVKATVREYGLKTQARVQELCPVDTGFMVDHVRLVFSPAEYVYEVGWDAGDFAGAGLPFYPPFQEWGTSKMPAQPSLQPAYAEIRPQFSEALARALRGAVEQAA